METGLSVRDLEELLVARHGMTEEDASDFVKAFFGLIEQELAAEGMVKVKGLGVFKTVAVEARDSVSVNSGERIQIAGYKKISFVPEPAVRELINKPFSCFESVVLKDSAVFDDLKEPEEEDGACEDLCDENGDAADVTDVEEAAPADADVCRQKEPEHEPEQPGEPAQETPVRSGKQTKDRWAAYLLAVACGVVALCAGLVLYLYWESDVASDVHAEEVEAGWVNEAVPDSAVHAVGVPEEARTAGTPVLKEDTAVRQKERVAPAAAVRRYADTVDYRIVGTKSEHTLKYGESLVRLSLKYYGTKALWPYIVRHNQDIIPDPDNVPVGSVLRIPELSAE